MLSYLRDYFKTPPFKKLIGSSGKNFNPFSALHDINTIIPNNTKKARTILMRGGVNTWFYWGIFLRLFRINSL